jgi:hypothetical protein
MLTCHPWQLGSFKQCLTRYNLIIFKNENLYRVESWLQVYIVFQFLVWFMVFHATFNNISVISWWSVLLVEETGVRRENHRPVTSYWQTLSHNVVSSTPRHERGSNSTLVVIGTDCIGSWKSNYHAITIMTVFFLFFFNFNI